MRGVFVAVVAVVVAAATGLAGWMLLSGQPGQTDGGLCAATMRFDGREYVGHGEVLRTPRLGDSIGTAATPDCNDFPGSTFDVFAIPGVPPSEAVFGDDGTWLRADPTSVPSEVREIQRLVTCTGTGRRVLAGRLVGHIGPPPTADYHAKAPYVAVFVADQGEHLPLVAYSSVTVRLRVRDKTVGGEDPDLVRAGLERGQRLTATVQCAGKAFEALSLSLDE